MDLEKSFFLFLYLLFLLSVVFLNGLNFYSSKIVENEITDSKKKQEYWETGIGLNKVDNLKPSKYLLDLSQKNINGELKYNEVENLLQEKKDHSKSRNRSFFYINLLSSYNLFRLGLFLIICENSIEFITIDFLFL